MCRNYFKHRQGGIPIKYYQPNGLGVDSTASLILLTEQAEKGLIPPFESVHVKHGGDGPWTYENLDQLREAGYKIIILEPEVQGFTDIYEFYYAEKIVPPVFLGRSCSWKWKINPQRRYYKEKGEPYTAYIGYDTTERHRIKPSPWKKVNLEYPLIDMWLTRHDCKRVIQDAGLQIPKKSGCYFCPFQSKESWMILKRDYPELFEKACQLEDNSPSMKLYFPTKKEQSVRSLRGLSAAPPSLFDIDIGCRMCVFGLPSSDMAEYISKSGQEVES